MRFPLPHGTIMEISNLVPSCSASVEGEIFHPSFNSSQTRRSQCLQNLNGLSIVFYRSQSAYTTLTMYTKLEWLVHRILSFTACICDACNVNIDYRPVWGSLRLAPIKYSCCSTKHMFVNNCNKGAGGIEASYITVHS